MKLEDFLKYKKKLSGYEEVHVITKRAARLDLRELLYPFAEKGRVDVAFDHSPFLLTDLANTRISSYGYSIIPKLWEYCKNEEQPADKAAEIRTASPETKKHLTPKEQHDLYEKLMSQLHLENNPAASIQEFLSIKLTDYFEYLNAVCSEGDLREYGIDDVQKTFYQLCEKDNVYAYTKTIILAHMLLLGIRLPKHSNYIVDKLLTEPFKMLRKENIL